jgi:hypothetical protein
MSPARDPHPGNANLQRQCHPSPLPGQHFKRMLKLEHKFYNVDVWEGVFSSTQQKFVGEPTQLFRTPLARASEAKT